MTDTATIQTIYRYPVKGLSPEALSRTALRQGEMLRNDRRYAVENGPSGFDPAEPKWLSKIHFLMLMRDERLAALHTRFDDDSATLTISLDGREVAQGSLDTASGRAAIESFLAGYCATELRGPPRVIASDGHRFSDVPRKVVSVINLATIDAIGALVGQAIDPLRFRANFYVAGWPAWREFDLIDTEWTAGSARLKVVKRIVRCAAVNVDPVTAARDLDIPRTLQQTLGHADCGIYAEVIADGEAAVGDRLAPVSSPA